MQVFQEMVWKGCERSVITYSSLISACEKAGHWELAMELFNEMHQEGCTPNTVTYNSLITACAQGQQHISCTDRQSLACICAFRADVNAEPGELLCWLSVTSARHSHGNALH